MLRGVARLSPWGLTLLVTVTATEVPPREHESGVDLGYALLIAIGVLTLAAGFLARGETLKKRGGAAHRPEWYRT